ncbi:HAD family hydrolase [Actinocorallia sp. A-T 12471]|uniref:HAD family hydrolase n=1 Tax=Actinocorallia sp. A-T 12471 TaxID=3089813 RepID=UPI0029CE84B1|nr:HAD family hydrolase [Actinocorallia sp. A-T 12471]MDX6744709.1 HAD family hydrolase [Actinocorallia sp. A-T 12471]
MTVVVCADLDRTLIYSANALALDPADVPSRLLCVELYQARPLSYITEEAAADLELLTRRAVFVPTTTRTQEQYARISLPGPPPRFAICANGGRLLVDGEEDTSWTSGVRKRVAECAPVLDVFDRVTALSGDFTRSVRIAADLFVYTVVDRAALPSGWLEDLTAWCAARAWTVSLQGRKVYFLPAPLTKSAAAREVATRSGATALLAAGDSLLDAELLAVADAAIRPAHGELHETAHTGSTVTRSSGIRAGAEITSWLLSRTLDPTTIPPTGPWRL